MSKALYLGDDVRLGALIRKALSGDGFQVEQTADVEAGVSSSREGLYAVAIVDWNQAGAENGLQIGRELRAAAPETGVILCTPARCLPKCWRALTEACDEHVIKPFAASELSARVHRILLRRSHKTFDDSATVACGSLVADFLRQTIHVDGREIMLQPLQLRLLGYLIRNAGRAVSHEELREQVFRVVQSPGSTNIARQICVLRDRLGSAGSLIVTTRGGYGLDIFTKR